MWTSTQSNEIDEIDRRLLRKNEGDKPSFLLSYGSDITKEIIALFDGKSNPFRYFTAEEIISATNNFQEKQIAAVGSLYRGCFGNRLILVEIINQRNTESSRAEFVRGLAIASQLSHHKNAIKLLGVCLELYIPAIVYEDSGGLTNFNDLLFEVDNTKVQLGWSNRLRIAKGIASILDFLHTGFSTPLIYRGLWPPAIFIDQSGVPKLLNFYSCVVLPPEKQEVDDEIVGTFGYISTEYFKTGIVSTKCDVYSFGVVLLNLLTGQRIHDLIMKTNPDNRSCTLSSCIEESIRDKDDLRNIVDQRLLATGDELEHEEQVQAFLNLVIKCISENGVDQPEMIDVAKELKRIEKIQ